MTKDEDAKEAARILRSITDGVKFTPTAAEKMEEAVEAWESNPPRPIPGSSHTP